MEPIARDENMPLGGLSFPRMGEERLRYIRAVDYELEFPHFRWTKDYIVPRLVELLNNNSGRPHGTGRQ
jgi:hypothetical protein